jgi:hypothetical protein
MFRFLTNFAKPRLAAFAVAAAMTACGGGSVATSPLASPTPPPSVNVASSTTGPTVVPALASGGVTATGSLAASNVATTILADLAVAPPSGVPALSISRANAASRTFTADTSSDTPLAYESFGAPVAVTIAAGSSLTFSLSSVTVGVNYFLAYYNGTAWVAPFAGPGVVSGTSVTVSPVPSFSIAANGQATFALFSSPAVPPVTSLTTVSFDVTATPAPQTISVSEPNFAGAFTPSMTCTASPSGQSPASSAFVAQISPTQATPASAGASVAFTITPGLETGTCSLTFSDGSRSSAAVTVTTSGSTLGVSSAVRK